MNDPHATNDSSAGLTQAQLAHALAAATEHLRRIGVTHLPHGDVQAGARWLAQYLPSPAAAESPPPAAAAVPPPAAAAPATPNAAPPNATPPASAAPPAAENTPQKSYPLALPLAERQTQLQQMAAQVAACTRCAELVASRRQTVFGEGSAEARVVFFGEAPGAEEDQQGRPFVGRAGQLLDKMIEACTLRREDVYLLNTLKCRPPNNRNPLPDELDNCRPYFEAQLDVIQPEYIVCLGLFAAQSLLRSKLSVGRLRGRFHDYQGSKVLVTYHPSYLLRNVSAKRFAWQDLQMMMADMGVSP